jgi:hypothetical protein
VPDPDDGFLQSQLVVINIVVRSFAESLERQDTEVAQVDWVPPAGGAPEMLDLLENLL